MVSSSQSQRRIHALAVAGACLLLALSCEPASALTIEHSNATYNNKHYEFEMVAIIDAPIERVQAVLRDYEGYKDLDPRILEARVIERPTSYLSVLETTLH